MPLQFHNQLTKRVDEFVSQEPSLVKMYTCGPTVYDYPHVGNWSGYVYWDVLVRLLQVSGYQVDRVMNITDVGHLVSDADEGEDKLEKGAKREGKTAWDVAAFYTENFMQGIKKLGLIEPTHITKATDFIEEQLELVRILKNKGYTYQIDDGIYYDTSKFPTYAQFADLDVDAQKAGARVEFNPEKRNHSDFALWKFTPAGENRDMEWDTPEDLLESESSRADASTEETQAKREPRASTGVEAVSSEDVSATGDHGAKKGFPGWHLECSAMSMTLLGHTLDIHTGGIDHIPVHHTNEIAQSEAATGERFSNYWLHNNHLKVNGTKLSKSLGNGYTLEDLEERGFSPLDFRMFVLQSHYRTEGNFTFENLEAARNRLKNWRNIAALRHQMHDTLQNDDDKSTDEKTVSLYSTAQAIVEATSDDLNTPAALSIIDDAFDRVVAHNISGIHQHAFISLLERIDELFGLQLLSSTPDISDALKQLIIERERVRDHKDWAKSDELRDQIEKEGGITLRDTADGTIWEYK